MNKPRLPSLRRIGIFLFVGALTLAFAGAAQAGAMAHYAPGVLNIRDYYVPDESGFYGLLYTPYYHAGQFHDAHGNAVNSVNVNPGPGPGVNLGVNTSVDSFVVAPMIAWVSPCKVLGARYGAYIVPSFANSNVSASVDTSIGIGASHRASQFVAGDLFVQPVWLDWEIPHADFSAGYGFYAPIGKYNVDTRNITGPLGNTVQLRGAAADNVGLGFWENQFQGAAAWYPWEDKRMAVSLAGTYELNSKKRFQDVTPGSYFTFNWGISQYLPLKGKDLLLEVGPAGYLEWQTSYDSGGDVHFNALSSVAAVGFQTGLTYVPWTAFCNFHYSNEFLAKARLQGDMYVFSVGKKLF